MRGPRGVWIIAAVGLAAGTARADCPTAQASCLLHEEGVALLAANKYDEAVAKFEASLTAGATARAALGYAQALRGAGRTGLAFEAIIEADRLSQWELRATPNDAQVVARAQRIRYVLGELRAEVGLVHVQLPPNVPPQQLLALQREGRDVRDPRGAVAVAPGDTLVAVMRNGARYEGANLVAAGGEATWVVPVVAAPQPQPQPMPRPIPMPQPAPVPVMTLPGGRIGADFVVMPASQQSGNTTLGVLVRAATPISPRWAATGRLGYLPHLGSSDSSGNAAVSLSESEYGAWGGVTAMLGMQWYAAAEVGVLGQSATADFVPFDGSPSTTVSNTLGYLVYTVGIGARLGRLDVRIGIEAQLAGLGQSQTGTQGDLPTRAMLSAGWDLWTW